MVKYDILKNFVERYNFKIRKKWQSFWEKIKFSNLK